ncbi:MAG: Cof-type HAD-IIB family hydrolase [Turicibacter sp.]|nr:Cof-type HAD-IIB family hydrolase [Turicibacter sp.]
MKLFASDYDGTFYRHDRTKNEISTNNLEVKKWRDAGNLFIFATGRSISMMHFERRFRKIKYDYLVGLNGAIIVDQHDRILFRKDISPPVAHAIVNLLEEKGLDSYSITDGFSGHLSGRFSFLKPDRLLFRLVGLMTRTYHLSREAALKLPVAQIALTTNSHEEAHKVAEMINETFKGEAFAFANLIHVDIQAPGLSKATGMGYVSKKHQVKQENAYGMGDSYNDIPMFEAYRGISLPGAKEAIKMKAEALYETVGHALGDLL